MVRWTSGGGPVRSRQRAGGLVEGAEAVGGQLVEAGHGVAVGRPRAPRPPSPGSMTTLSMSTTRWRQWSKAASCPITARTASGWPMIVVRDVGKVLDLPDHVVAQVADQAGVERRQVGQVRGVEGVEDGLEGGQHSARPADPVRR